MISKKSMKKERFKKIDYEFLANKNEKKCRQQVNQS